MRFHPARFARALVIAGLMLSPIGSARAQFGGRIIIGPPPYPPEHDFGLGGYGGARGLSSGYGWWPDYSWNWPSLREALALRRTPAGLVNPNDYAVSTGVDGHAERSGAAPPFLGGEAMPIGAAVLRVHVPAAADLRINGSATRLRGDWRQFVTPPLPGDRQLAYDIEATWMEQGQIMRRTHGVRVSPGDRLTIDFLTPPQENATLPPPRVLPK